jgi:hypothetical protein
MTTMSSPIYHWRAGEVEITRVLEFEAALFEPRIIYPEASPEITERHRAWLEPTLMDPASGLLVFAFHSTVIKTPQATILVDTCSKVVELIAQPWLTNNNRRFFHGATASAFWDMTTDNKVRSF